MRVISGTARGTKLRSISVPSLRPMLDRVKEAVFNIIRGEADGAKVLDLFSGSASLGIEALSRGASSCVFVEKDARLARLAWENICKCRFEGRSELLRLDFFAMPNQPAPEGKLPSGLLFLDPPYRLVEEPDGRLRLFRTLEALGGSWIAPGALIVLHHSPTRTADWPGQILQQQDSRVYGKSQITFFRFSQRHGTH